jgi:signal transduction histidine kinase
MLTPIMGYAEMLLDDLAPDDGRRDGIDQIIRSAERSRDLVRQLLAFARRQTLEMKPVSLNKIITGFRSMLQRTLHENVKIEFRLEEGLGIIQADPGQLEQIIMNLAVNAQDAMPDGGTLIIETGERVFDDACAREYQELPPGTYIVMSQTDTGTGMDAETLSHLFEPFYTTKAPARARLGLARLRHR